MAVSIIARILCALVSCVPAPFAGGNPSAKPDASFQEVSRTFESWSGGERIEDLRKGIDSRRPTTLLDSFRLAVQWVDLANLAQDVKISRQALDRISSIEASRLPAPWRVFHKSYLGIASSLVGRDATNPIEKIQKVQEACSQLDEAVRAGADSGAFPIFVRGLVLSSLPDFFEKRETARQDLQRVLDRGAAGDWVVSPGVRCRAETRLGEILKGKGSIKEAIPLWKHAAEANAGQCSETARRWLATYQD